VSPKPGQTLITSYLCKLCMRLIEHSVPVEPVAAREKLEQLIKLSKETKIFIGYNFIQQSVIQSVVHAFKYYDMPRLAFAAGEVLGTAALTHLEDFDLLLPVPLHRTRLADRTYNQSERLAAGISNVWKVPVARPTLVRRKKPTKTQTSLSESERWENVRDAFVLSRTATLELQDKRVVIIDDVLTTGATIASIASLLQDAGITSIHIMTLSCPPDLDDLT
jgi:ComF family protein